MLAELSASVQHPQESPVFEQPHGKGGAAPSPRESDALARARARARPEAATGRLRSSRITPEPEESEEDSESERSEESSEESEEEQGAPAAAAPVRTGGRPTVGGLHAMAGRSAVSYQPSPSASTKRPSLPMRCASRLTGGRVAGLPQVRWRLAEGRCCAGPRPPHRRATCPCRGCSRRPPALPCACPNGSLRSCRRNSGLNRARWVLQAALASARRRCRRPAAGAAPGAAVQPGRSGSVRFQRCAGAARRRAVAVGGLPAAAAAAAASATVRRGLRRPTAAAAGAAAAGAVWLRRPCGRLVQPPTTTAAAAADACVPR